MRLLVLLCVPTVIRTDCRFVVSGREAFCVLLFRLAFPCRLTDMRLVFGLKESCASETFNFMVHFLDDKWGHQLDLDVAGIKPKLTMFTAAVQATGAPLANWWAFIDGTGRAVSRPVRGQRAVYNGHKKLHALKYQGLVTPDGIIADLWGLTCWNNQACSRFYRPT
ncbi:unnamed protein product [Sphacelaria rigidula]